MRLMMHILVVLQSATVAWLLVRYDPDAHYAASAQRATSVILGGMMDSCHRMLEPGGRQVPSRVDDRAAAMSGRA